MKLKTIEKSLVLGLVLVLIFNTATFFMRCSQIRQEVLRLHVLANSDSDYDQTLKLKVRDRILEESETLFCGFDTKTQAIDAVKENIAYLEQIATDELQKNGCEDAVEIEIADTYFETREYENVTLPAGVYEAVRVKIGKAQGKNWWCVMFPQLCVPSVTSRDDIEDVLNDDQVQIVENREKYKVGFWLVEAVENVKNLFR